MAWSEVIQGDLIIITGDGKKYTPLYDIAPKSFDYNTAVFDFPNINGSLVDRKKKQGTKHTLSIYFDGDDHLEKSLAFEASLLDERPWKVYYPIWGNLLMQPISVSQDPTGLSITRFTIELIETISRDYPKAGIDPVDRSNFDILKLKELSAVQFSNSVQLEASDIKLMQNQNEAIFNIGVKDLKVGDEYNAYLDVYNSAKSALKNVSTTYQKAITTVNLMVATASFTQNVKTKIEGLAYQFTKLLPGKTPNQKKIYELNATAIITAAVDSAVNAPSGEYQNATDVLYIINQLVTVYNSFVIIIDGNQTVNNGNSNSYVPDHDTMLNLQNVVDYSISQLFNIALTAQQKRTLILTEESNAIILAHRFYGADATDQNLVKFMSDNNIVLNNLFVIEKGTEVIWYQ